MGKKINDRNQLFLQRVTSIWLALWTTICLLRIFEYITTASKSFALYAFRYEAAGWIYDSWLCMIYLGLIFIPIWLISRINKKAAHILFHTLNILLITASIALLITFSERNTPFDHELFTRKSKDSVDTVKQVMGSGIKPYLPFLIFLPLYFAIYSKGTLRFRAEKPFLIFLGISSLASIVCMRFANPLPAWFSDRNAYYLTANKLSYWVQDSYLYANRTQPAVIEGNLAKEIVFYQSEHPFQFTSSEYPLLHKNDEPDVLGGFFNLTDKPPNIVVLVVEGLSRDFSGSNAYAGSFTPFLDSLSEKSLVWDNFLSTAPGTFAAHPAISGSLPYGKKGFSIMNVMPDHLSLIRILRNNGYFTRFWVGFNPDFDNMGGYIRLQGTDFILSHYPSRYKEMGIGKEGWSMGYPDDALYSRSFEIMDSLPRQPYLNIYHTGTTHLPYLFDQKKQYEKKFDQKLRKMVVAPDIRRILEATKEVLVTFMFSDDCIRNFFSTYARRPAFSNTIFVITGDHHIGSFPSRGEMDDYHVPFIIYSPLLKKPERFLSVNSHNNIAPTLMSLLQHHYDLRYRPDEVNWLGAVMDTARKFRNQQSMAFMSWSRDITDYLYKDYFISGNELYTLQDDLGQEKIKNDTLAGKLIRLRENFKVINRYVCDSNKIFPVRQSMLPGKKTLLYTVQDSSLHDLNTMAADTSLLPYFKIPQGYRYLYVEVNVRCKTADKDPETCPTVRFGLIDRKDGRKQFLYWSKRDLATLSRLPFLPEKWNDLSVKDLFILADYRQVKDLYFELALFGSPNPIQLSYAGLEVKIYGIKQYP